MGGDSCGGRPENDGVLRQERSGELRSSRHEHCEYIVVAFITSDFSWISDLDSTSILHFKVFKHFLDL